MKTIKTKIDLFLTIVTLTLYRTVVFAAKVNLDELVPRPGQDLDVVEAIDNPELGVVNNLPSVTPENFFTSAIKTMLGISMLLTLAAIIAVSFYYLTAMGEEEQLNKAKNIILYLIIGIAIMAGAYGIISGVAQFNFFN